MELSVIEKKMKTGLHIFEMKDNYNVISSRNYFVPTISEEFIHHYSILCIH